LEGIFISELISSYNEILAVLYFDEILGPNYLYSSVPIPDEEDFPNLKNILEFNDEEGGFIFSYRKYQTLNYLFYIKSKHARGGKDLIMISYMIRAAYFRHEIVDIYKYLESLKPILKYFSLELSTLEELPDVLHNPESKSFQKNIFKCASEEFKEKFLLICNKYFAMLSPRYDIMNLKPDTKKIFIFGTPNAGKCTLLRNLEVAQVHAQKKKKDFISKIYDIIIENIQVLDYDCIKNNFDCSNCIGNKRCMENAYGFIFMFNASKPSSLEKGKKIVQKVLTRVKLPGNSPPPILIIGNIFDNAHFLDNQIVQDKLGLAELEEDNIKYRYLPMNVMRDEGEMMEGIRWLLKEIV